VLTETTADLTWALLLACARRVVEADNYARSGRFEGWEPLLMLGVDVFSKTLGIIGMGRIGSAVARRAEGFGMKVLWFDPQVDPKTVSDKYERADLRHLCSSSDFISIHVPLTPDTHHLVNSELLSLMRPTAVLINTARGPIVDEEALIKALRDKKIAAAGLDVFENEPEIPAELLELENAVLLPHIGSASIETRTKMALMAAENAIAVIQGTEPPARVN
jgi:glyoxylate reductase